MNQHDLHTIHRTIKDLSNEDIIIVAIPGSVTNSGKQQEVLQVGVVCKSTGRDTKFIYRGTPDKFRETLLKAIDEVKKPRLITKPNGGLF